MPQVQQTELEAQLAFAELSRAKDLLRTQGIGFDEIVVGRDTKMSAVTALTGRATVPQVFLDGRHIGGSVELADWVKQRKAA